MLTRRNIAKAVPMLIAIGAVAACSSNTSGGAIVPTLATVQSWVGIINSELPAFVAESIQTGLLTGGAVTTTNQAVSTFQTLAAQFLSPTFTVSNAPTLVSEIGTALTTVLAVLPATAPYVGFIQLGVLVVSAFLATTPIVVPPAPTPAALSSMHMATLHYHRK